MMHDDILMLLTLQKIMCLMLLGLSLFTPFKVSASSPENQAGTASQTVTKDSIIDTNSFRDLRPMTQNITVQKVIDGLTFLGSDNQIYRLSGIEIPNPETDLGQSAVASLRTLIEGKPIKGFMTKAQDKGRTNRMGQILLHAVTKDNVWVQGYLIENGLARVATSFSNPEQAAAMLAIESRARTTQKNIWARDESRVVTSDEVLSRLNSTQVVEGTVTAVASMRNQLYLNFGFKGQNDWRKDFTIGVSPTLRKALARKHIDPMQLQSARVRVRGWVQSYNGAYIELDHPEQLEVLSKGIAQPASQITAPIMPDITKPQIQQPKIQTPNLKPYE
jgi:micrococcal nuclease